MMLTMKNAWSCLVLRWQRFPAAVHTHRRPSRGRALGRPSHRGSAHQDLAGGLERRRRVLALARLRRWHTRLLDQRGDDRQGLRLEPRQPRLRPRWDPVRLRARRRRQREHRRGRPDRRGGGQYTAGTAFQVAVESGVIQYRVDGTSVRSTTVTVAYPLLVDCSLYDDGATITNAQLTGTWLAHVVWANGVDVVAGGGDLFKASAVGG